MTASPAMIGHGTTLELDTTSPPTGISGDTWLPINGVTDVAFGSNKVDTLDITNLTTTGNVRQYTTGLEDPGDASIKLNLLPGDTSQQTLLATKGTGVLQYFETLLTGALGKATFAGFITGWDDSFPDDKLITRTVKIKISGSVTRTY